MRNTWVRVIAGGALLLAAGWAQAQETVYTITSIGTYSSVTNFTPPCAFGPCQNYTTAMGVSGWFRTAAPIAPNLSGAQVHAQVTAYSFSDGLNTYTSGDSNGRVHQFQVSTNALGAISSGTYIQLQTWQTGASPHVVGDRVAALFLDDASGAGRNNAQCDSVSGPPPSGAPDICMTVSALFGQGSSAASNAGISWTSAPYVAPATSAIPTLSEWGLIMLAGLMGWAGSRARRRTGR